MVVMNSDPFELRAKYIRVRASLQPRRLRNAVAGRGLGFENVRAAAVGSRLQRLQVPAKALGSRLQRLQVPAKPLGTRLQPLQMRIKPLGRRSQRLQMRMPRCRCPTESTALASLRLGGSTLRSAVARAPTPSHSAPACSVCSASRLSESTR